MSKQSRQGPGVLSSFAVKWSRETGHLDGGQGTVCVCEMMGGIKEMPGEKRRRQRELWPEQEGRVGLRAGWREVAQHSRSAPSRDRQEGWAGGARTGDNRSPHAGPGRTSVMD